MNKIKNILLIIVFITAITLPQFIHLLFYNENNTISESEKRKLSDIPKLELATITEYPGKFEAYYNDHTPFRTQLINLWANLNYDIFKTIANNNKVLMGKEGWLFYRGNQVIEQTQGIVSFTEKEKKNILSAMQDNINKLEQKGIETYYFIAPNKTNIYREKLPESICIKNDTTQAEELIKYVEENSDIKIIYPKDELIAYKEKCDVYRKYDTHWNNIGALIGAITIQKNIDNNFSYDINDIEVEITKVIDENDLATAAGLDKKLYQYMPRVTNFYSDVKTEKIENGSISDSDNEKTVLIIGDSFGTMLEQYFSKLYKKVILIHRDDYKKEYLEGINPDIVIVEAAERLSYILDKQLL